MNWERRLIREILWVDSLAALSTGLMMLVLAPWLGGFYGLPATLVRAHAAVHLAYGTYSGSLAIRQVRSLGWIQLLIFANAAWAMTCFAVAATVARDISVWWTMSLVCEGAFVGGLAAIEWSVRERLTRRRPA